MKDQWIMIDVKTDGPLPGNNFFSMLSIGLVNCKYPEKTFYAEFAPISDNFVNEALEIKKFTRLQSMQFPSPIDSILKLRDWLSVFNTHSKYRGRLRAIADNPGFHWSFLNYYMYAYIHKNPLGYSCNDLGMIYRGVTLDLTADIDDYHRELNDQHTHNALDDALLNYKKFMLMIEEYDLVV